MLQAENLIPSIKKWYEEFKLKAQKSRDEEPPFHNYPEVKAGNELYEYTKEFLETYKTTLSPSEKGEILHMYMGLWYELDCELDIELTEYAEDYRLSRFGKYSNTYNESHPMTAGFNLENADLSKIGVSDINFLSVNFRGASFGDAKLPYCHFENCDLSKITTESKHSAIFSQCQFVKCSLEEADLQRAELCEVSFFGCDVRSTIFEKGDKQYRVDNLNFYNTSVCNNKTIGLRRWYIKSSNAPDINGDLQNIDNPKVKNHLKTLLNEEVPILLKNILEGKNPLPEQKEKKAKTTIKQKIDARTARLDLYQLIKQKKCTEQDVLKALASGANINLNCGNYRNAFLLNEAMQANLKEVVISLLENSADVNIPSCGACQLQQAAGNKNLEMLEILLAHGKNIKIDITDDSMKTALQIATENKFTQGVSLLLKHGASATIKYPHSDKKPLNKAVRFEDHAIAAMLLKAEKDAGVVIKGDYGTELLTSAVFSDYGCNINTVNMLIAEGARVSIASNNTPLIHQAVRKNDVELTKALLKAGASVNTINIYGETTLQYAERKIPLGSEIIALLKAEANKEQSL